MGQVTSRISDELEAALDRWAAAEGRPRAQLIRDILAEAADANRQGRARFDRPDSVDLKDVQHLVAAVREQQIELKRILDHNISRDGALARSARADTLGVSEARTAILSRLATELQQSRDAVSAMIAGLPAEQAAALTASSQFVALVRAVDSQANALRELITSAGRWFEQPRIQNTYLVWDKNWSRRRVAAALLVLWLLSASSYIVLTRMLAPTWLSVRSANMMLGEGENSTCALVRYRLKAATCQIRYDGDTMTATLEAPGIPRARAR